MKWTHRSALVAGLALLATTNLVALGGAAYNRSGEPQTVLNVSQRELRPSYPGAREKENSGLTLRLRWRVLEQDESSHYIDYREGGGTPAWLDEAKMASLGFEPLPAASQPSEDVRRRHPLPRDVLIVLEFNGPTYRQALDRARGVARKVEEKNERGEGKKDAEEIVVWAERLSSRLFAVDAGLDRASLRAKYPDRQKYVIVRGRVRQDWWGRATAGGRIDRLLADEINVPLELRAAFDGIGPGHQAQADGEERTVQARLAFGQRLEPWLVEAAGHEVRP
jgi:hypothetical protein